MDDSPHDPTDQSGRPWMVTGVLVLIFAALAAMLVIGLVVL